ncbi:uncharacterized protein EMH_0039260 [Eimeria mitis]|uniref:SAG family member n=1 Tax=Eimeria mitis TaxID=44415 RepID=U6JXK7_9EIME|nr:uncharacterized protein EMH_0039260 [Eimeria mitis]CDJ28253.1 hypothetical protein EMH_0039260 [Eimeria mitis]
MASFYKTAAAVCLVALGVLQSEAQQEKGNGGGEAACLVALGVLQSNAQQDPIEGGGGSTTYKFTVVNVDEDAYLSANLARNGKLPVHISEVTKDESIVNELTAKVTAQEQPAADSCTALLTTKLKENFHYSFDYEPKSETSPDYRQLLQKALDAGLTVFDEEYFNGLIERTTQLKDMTKDDLKNSVGNGPVATASTILIAGLVAMLTAVSA